MNIFPGLVIVYHLAYFLLLLISAVQKDSHLLISTQKEDQLWTSF